MFNMISSVPKPYAESISDTSVDRDEVSDKEQQQTSQIFACYKGQYEDQCNILRNWAQENSTDVLKTLNDLLKTSFQNIANVHFVSNYVKEFHRQILKACQFNSQNLKPDYFTKVITLKKKLKKKQVEGKLKSHRQTKKYIQPYPVYPVCLFKGRNCFDQKYLKSLYKAFVSHYDMAAKVYISETTIFIEHLYNDLCEKYYQLDTHDRMVNKVNDIINRFKDPKITFLKQRMLYGQIKTKQIIDNPNILMNVEHLEKEYHFQTQFFKESSAEYFTNQSVIRKCNENDQDPFENANDKTDVSLSCD